MTQDCRIYLGMGGLALRGSDTSACAQLSCSLPCLQDAINAHVYIYIIGMATPPICVCFVGQIQNGWQ